MLIALLLCAVGDGKCRYCDKPLTAEELSLAYLLTVCSSCYKKFIAH